MLNVFPKTNLEAFLQLDLTHFSNFNQLLKIVCTLGTYLFQQRLLKERFQHSIKNIFKEHYGSGKF